MKKELFASESRSGVNREVELALVVSCSGCSKNMDNFSLQASTAGSVGTVCVPHNC